MYLIPLVYFSALTYYLWNRNRIFDVSVYMSLLYVVTSICCVLMMITGSTQSSGGVLMDGWSPDFGFIPTILYCGLITLTIWPFTYLRPEKIERITNTHRKTLYLFSALILIQGLLMIYLVGDSVADLMNGDFKDLKESAYQGDISPADVKMLRLPLPFQVLFLTSHLTLLGLPLFFYYSCVEQRSLWLTVPLLIISVSPILRGIIIADRTEIINFGLMFLFCLVFFRKFMTKKIRVFFYIMSVPVVLLASVYFIAVSMSRFEDNDEGTGGTVLEYAGQAYPNFCYFYDNHNSDLYYLHREFPITSFLFFKTQYPDTKAERSAKEGFFIGVFASHVGSWMLDGGVMFASLLSVVYSLICLLVIYRRNRRQFDVGDVLLLFALSNIPIFGIFYYRFYHMVLALQLLMAFMLFVFSKFVIVWVKDEMQAPESLSIANE